MLPITGEDPDKTRHNNIKMRTEASKVHVITCPLLAQYGLSYLYVHSQPNYNIVRENPATKLTKSCNFPFQDNMHEQLLIQYIFKELHLTTMCCCMSAKLCPKAQLKLFML